MKKIWSSLILAVFSACAWSADKSVTENPPLDTISITFNNQVEVADAWLIPDTEENRKTSLWGKATVAQSTPGTPYAVKLVKTETGAYLLRMIDAKGMFYDAGTMTLLDGYTVIVVQHAVGNVELVVSDAKGKTITQRAVFHAAL